VGLLGVVVTATSVRLQSLAPDSSGTAEVVYLPDARLLRPLVLGYDNVLANVLWFRTISYFGGTTRAIASTPGSRACATW
jgi:hypothetical protein